MPTLATPSLPVLTRLPSLNEAPTTAGSSAPATQKVLTPAPLRHAESPLDALLRRSLEAGSAAGVRQSLVDRLAELWGAQKVALGWRRHGEGAWRSALSGQGRIDPRSDLGRALAAAMAETALSKERRRWCGTESPVPAVPLSYRQLAGATGALAISGIPLAIGKQPPRAALLVLDASGPELLARDDEVVAIAAALAGLGRLCDDATPNLLSRTHRWLVGLLARKRLASILGISAMLALFGFFPLAERISCPATLEPSVRRYIAAPFDGKLEKAVVKVGDTVTTGQPLALFDRKALEIELSTQAAGFEEAAKRRDSARAKGQAAQAQLAHLEAAQIQTKIDQLERQLSELTVMSPISGMIVRGQLQRIEGAPIARGQNLFEVAPLSPLVAELAIPEEEVALVKPGQSVAIRPVALGSSLTGTIERIHPRAEVRDGQTVFIAEVSLDNSAGTLLPGMQARGVIYGNRRPLAWSLIRRPLSRLSRWTRW